VLAGASTVTGARHLSEPCEDEAAVPLLRAASNVASTPPVRPFCSPWAVKAATSTSSAWATDGSETVEAYLGWVWMSCCDVPRVAWVGQLTRRRRTSFVQGTDGRKKTAAQNPPRRRAPEVGLHWLDTDVLVPSSMAGLVKTERRRGERGR
jgi:hypothetical protein